MSPRQYPEETTGKLSEQTWYPEEGRSGEEKPGSGSLRSSSLRLLRGLHCLVHHQHWLSIVLKQNSMVIKEVAFPFGDKEHNEDLSY